MLKLIVRVKGYGLDAALMALPFKVYMPSGQLLAVGAVSPAEPTEIEFPELEGIDGTGTLPQGSPGYIYVVAALPSGSETQHVVEFVDGVGKVVLNDDLRSPHEWLQWVTPFRSLDHFWVDQRADPSESEPRRPDRHIGQVWATLWRLDEEGQWTAEQADTFDHQRDKGMQQFTIEVPRMPHLLQIGGAEVSWRLVSLPTGGPVRVALTRSADAQGDALEITIGRGRPDNELIMSYLARGEVAEAERLGDSLRLAERMLQKKYDDPVAAAAAAYYLLKTNRLEDHRDWLENLTRDFPDIADGQIVAAALERQRSGGSEDYVRFLVEDAMNRGLPIFSLGARLLVESMAAIHRGHEEADDFHRMYLAAQAYARAICSKGAYMAFHGLSPVQPVWVPLYGLEGSPRATPLSEGGGKPIFLPRPRGTYATGIYGKNRISLPRAPVTNELLRPYIEGPWLREATDGVALSSNNVPSLPSFIARNSYEGGLPAVQLRVPTFHSPDALYVEGRQALRLPLSPDYERDRAPSAQNRPRRVRPLAETPSYWKNERIINSISVFDGDE